ncbi:MAG: CPBP family intramembrane glutamic endopeptidase [Chloroherpetonaceae bacterium]|nr:CPBP family intramembrane glutamic endopeptidase [Chloroherpetonaceae bacterium]
MQNSSNSTPESDSPENNFVASPKENTPELYVFNETRLNGWFEQHGFSPLVANFIVLVFIFVTYQFLGGLIMVMAILVPKVAEGEDPQVLIHSFNELITSNVELIRLIQSGSQFLFILLPVFYFTKLHSNTKGLLSQEHKAFLGLTPPVSGKMYFYAFFGILALNPILSYFNDLQFVALDGFGIIDQEDIQSLRSVFRTQIENIATSYSFAEYLVVVAVISITPAIAEELLFRGFVQRNFLRVLHPQTAAILTGIIFGIYHLNPLELFPLIGLGIYLALVRQYSGSVYPAALAHFANNWFSVTMLALSKNPESFGLSDEMASQINSLTPDIESPLAIGSALISLLLTVLIWRAMKIESEKVPLS